MSDWPKGFLEFAEPVSGVTDVMRGTNARPTPEEVAVIVGAVLTVVREHPEAMGGELTPRRLPTSTRTD